MVFCWTLYSELTDPLTGKLHFGHSIPDVASWLPSRPATTSLNLLATVLPIQPSGGQLSLIQRHTDDSHSLCPPGPWSPFQHNCFLASQCSTCTAAWSCTVRGTGLHVVLSWALLQLQLISKMSRTLEMVGLPCSTSVCNAVSSVVCWNCFDQWGLGQSPSIFAMYMSYPVYTDIWAPLEVNSSHLWKGFFSGRACSGTLVSNNNWWYM